MLDDDDKSGVLEEIRKLGQRGGECLRVGLAAGGGMDFDPSDDRVSDHLVQGSHIVNEVGEPLECSLTPWPVRRGQTKVRIAGQLTHGSRNGRHDAVGEPIAQLIGEPSGIGVETVPVRDLDTVYPTGRG